MKKFLKAFLILILVLIISIIPFVILNKLTYDSSNTLLNKAYAEDKAEKDPEKIINSSLETDKPLIVLFYSTWCGACQRIEPVYDDVAVDYKDKTDFLKVDVDEYSALANGFKVMRLPTIFAISPRTKEAIMLPAHKMLTTDSFKETIDLFLDKYKTLESEN